MDVIQQVRGQDVLGETDCSNFFYVPKFLVARLWQASSKKI